MFNQRKPKQNNTVNKKDNDIFDLDFVHKQDKNNIEVSEDGSEMIHPIIFTTRGNCINHGLIDLPIDYSRYVNWEVFGDKEVGLLDNMNKSLLVHLNAHNNGITQSQVDNYIRQESFMNFCSAFNASKYSKYFTMIPILEKVKERINNCNTIAVLTSEFFCYNDGYSTFRLENPKDAMETVSYAKSIAYLLAEVICTEIAFAADEAINDAIMQVYIVPNIKELYKELANENKALYELGKTSPENFPTYAAIYLKTLVREIIQVVMTSSIEPGISNIMGTIMFSNYTVFNDYLYYEIDAAHNQVISNKNRLEDK